MRALRALRAGVEWLFIYGEVLVSPTVLLNGWRYGRHHSILFPEGLHGEFPVADVTFPLTAEQFRRAELLGWPSSEEKVRFLFDSEA